MSISKKFIRWFTKNIVKKTIWLTLLIITVSIFIHHRFNSPQGVIIWDIKSYYSYLPATFIYNDLSFDFMKQDSKKFGKWIWPFETIKGKKGIRATMGMSVLYSPFFFVAHAIALVTDYEADGYSNPYHFALNFSAMFYLWFGLIFLAKALRRFYNEKVIAFTLFAIVIGTNLFYYTTREAPMSHSYLFSLFALFLLLTIRFYEKPSLKRIIIAGAVAGFITLVRPTNIIVLLVFFLWGVSSFSEFKDRIAYYLKKFHWVLLMASAFVVIWIPQFIYWYHISGKIFYFTYGEAGGKFFFNNPQIFNILFSYKKGWLVYTPLMIFALIGIFMLPKKRKGLFLPLLVFKMINIYILASWWSWWFGGGFGVRSFVESYAFLSIPLACFVDFGFRQKNLLRFAIPSALAILIGYNQFQTRQYNNNAIHWWWMNKEAYWETFLKLHPTDRFWLVVTLPDYDAARQGIYRELKSPQAIELEKNGYVMSFVTWKKPLPEKLVIDRIKRRILADNNFNTSIASDSIEIYVEERAKHLFNEKGYEYWDKEISLELIIEETKRNPRRLKTIEEKASINNITPDSQLLIDAKWLLEKEKEI